MPNCRPVEVRDFLGIYGALFLRFFGILGADRLRRLRGVSQFCLPKLTHQILNYRAEHSGMSRASVVAAATSQAAKWTLGSIAEAYTRMVSRRCCGVRFHP